jgi:hypothetical protein
LILLEFDIIFKSGSLAALYVQGGWGVIRSCNNDTSAIHDVYMSWVHGAVEVTNG